MAMEIGAIRRTDRRRFYFYALVCAALIVFAGFARTYFLKTTQSERAVASAALSRGAERYWAGFTIPNPNAAATASVRERTCIFSKMADT
jgi:hypothetical protein